MDGRAASFPICRWSVAFAGEGDMSWWLRRLVDFFGWLTAALAGRKYEVLAKRLGRQADAEEPGQRRFIAVQIDGLSHADLQRALEKGFAPTIRHLLEQGYRLERWRCGLPGSTPIVQAGIMYGENWDMPAFRWYEKDTGFAPVSKVPAHIERIRNRIANGRPGILSGGSSYSNMMDGGARLTLFTLSAMGRERFFEHLRGIGWALMLVLLPWRVLRMIGVTSWELSRDVVRTVHAWAVSGFRGRPKLLQPVLDVLANVVLSEVMAFGVALDIYRGIPAIYVTFYGYDEIAHGSGQQSRDALHALKRIDNYVHEFDRLRRMYQPDADLLILSDHGMTPSRSFRDLYGMSLSAAIGQCLEGVTIDDTWDPEASDTTSRRFLLDELDGIEAHLSQRSRRLVAALRRRMNNVVPHIGYGAVRDGAKISAGESVLAGEVGGDSLAHDIEEWDLARASDVTVRASGSMAHIYLNVTGSRMDISEVALLYPALLDMLADHPGIGLVVGVEDDRPVMVTSRGAMTLASDRLPPGLEEPEHDAADLRRLLQYPHAGDLVVFGAWDARGVITFEDHVASHGGLGGQQSYPLFLVPPGVPLEPGAITSARQLYPFFMGRYHGIEVAEQMEKETSPQVGK
jgi:hypothetical protein